MAAAPLSLMRAFCGLASRQSHPRFVLSPPSPAPTVEKRKCAGLAAKVARSDTVVEYGKKEIISLTRGLHDYILENIREPEVLRELREETMATMKGEVTSVSPDQAQLLSMLVQILGAEKCIEVGVFSGYSSLAIALALPENGRLIACEKDAKCIEFARRYYERAGVAHKVHLCHGLAIEALRTLVQNGEDASFDFAFVDADKTMYPEYYELLLQLVRPGGVIVLDDVLWSGKVAESVANDPITVSLRNLNKRIFEDKRVNTSMVSIGTGMTICRKL